MDLDLILYDLLPRLRFHPAMYEIRTGEVFRIDAINVDDKTFHVWHGEGYDWYNIKHFKPVLYQPSNDYNQYNVARVDSSFRIIQSIARKYNIKLDKSSLSFTFSGISKVPVSAIADVFEVLNYSFIDYRGFIESGLAIDVNKLNKNPYINNNGRSDEIQP